MNQEEKQKLLTEKDEAFERWWATHKEGVSVVSGRPANDLVDVFRLAFLEGYICATDTWNLKIGQALGR